MTRLFLSMLVKNEKDRYLSEILSFYEPLISGAVFLDNGSTDGTLEILESFSKTLAIEQDSTEFASNERGLRQKLFNMAERRLKNDDWILAVDADELLENKFRSEVNSMINNSGIYSYSFRFLHFWGSRTHYRCDGGWAPNLYGPRMIRYVNSIKYMWPAQSFACGSVPAIPAWLKKSYSPLFVKHLGYVNPLDMSKKYALYSKGPAAPYHAKAHVESIMKPPQVRLWTE